MIAMKKFLTLIAVAIVAAGLTAIDADAARLGGGTNIGKQRSIPLNRQAAPEAPTKAAPSPGTPAQAAPAPIPPQPQPSFLGRWGGMLAGFGLGALIGSMLGGNMGAGLGALLNILLIAGVIYLVFRFLSSRRHAAAQPMRYAGATGVAPSEPIDIGSGSTIHSSPSVTQQALPDRQGPNVPPGFEIEIEPFIRQAKAAFIRLQAANDARDLNDIRDYTTPEVYAELAMQMRERGEAAQKTEILTLNAQLLEVVDEGDYAIASVHYSGLIREMPGANAESFDEVWHVQKHIKDPKSTWLIAGIQQVA
jgi:predicted lipid-binding transport protein (Tim44 family)